MRLGYACINTALPTKFRTCRLATYEKKGDAFIKELTIHNLENIYAALKWNEQQKIFFYRISSDIVPLGSHEILTWKWWLDEDVIALAHTIKKFSSAHEMRLSMHPGQYSVLSTPREEVLQRTIADLDYHEKLLHLMGGTDMIIHGGGAYGDISKAKQRFSESYVRLPERIRSKLRLENDDVTYTLEDVLDIHTLCNIPICFDIHHHNCNNNGKDLEPMLNKVFASWSQESIIPKVHISSGKTSETDRRHHEYVFKQDFERLLLALNGKDVDIMLEAKMKEQAVLKIKKEVF
ncbi:UV DNA damage repair endonuclease UvsE [Salipaludibacillus sp. CF4.18]|uniref:UV DNA damage repair endonuclease UvsE n=1 Tax=Salipaludibacillus sp. CF4.18 TaxID=3373081 RepID=UPI003EE4C624